MSKSQFVYENETYGVQISGVEPPIPSAGYNFTSVYEIVNKQYAKVEGFQFDMPNAMNQADAMAHGLKYKPWQAYLTDPKEDRPWGSTPLVTTPTEGGSTPLN